MASPEELTWTEAFPLSWSSIDQHIRGSVPGVFVIETHEGAVAYVGESADLHAALREMAEAQRSLPALAGLARFDLWTRCTHLPSAEDRHAIATLLRLRGGLPPAEGDVEPAAEYRAPQMGQ